MDELTSEQVDAILADPNVAGSEAQHAYYWENGGTLPGQEWTDTTDEPASDADDHHHWLMGMGDAELAERLAACPDDAAAIERVHAERARSREQDDADGW